MKEIQEMNKVKEMKGMNGMNELKKARENYEATPIPEELNAVVQNAIQRGRKNYWQKRLKQSFGAVAACLAVMFGVLNLSPTAAAIAADIPILNGLFQIMTIRNFQEKENGIDFNVSVPEIKAEGALAQQVNAAIQEQVDAHLAKARQDWQEYKEAFFATGGTEAEWADREMNVIVDYEIKSQTDTSVSFVITLAESWVAAQEERYYYNLDLAANQTITLQMLLGDDWVQICNDAINRAIAESVDEQGFTFFFAADEGGFAGVDADTTFYIRADGTPVVTFPKYAIAAGAAGIPEFPIIAE